jgi:hypothetical protein
MLNWLSKEFLLATVAALAIALIAVSWGGTPSRYITKQIEAPPQKTEQKTDDGAPQKQITNPNNNSSRQWIISVEQIVAAELQKASNYCTTDSSQKQDKWLQDFFCGIKITDVVIAIFSILLVFVTIGLVLVGWIQARRMRVTARQQLRAYVFVDSIVMGNVTTPLAWEVVSSYTPTGAEITHTALGPVTRMVIKNTGQTPAHRVVHWGDIVLREFPLKGKLPPFKRALFITKTSIPAGGVSFKNLIMPRPLLADEVGDLKKGVKAIYVFGYIKYRDAFGKRRITHYRFMYGSMSGGVGITTGMTICDEGNYAN